MLNYSIENCSSFFYGSERAFRCRMHRVKNPVTYGQMQDGGRMTGGEWLMEWPCDSAGYVYQRTNQHIYSNFLSFISALDIVQISDNFSGACAILNKTEAMQFHFLFFY